MKNILQQHLQHKQRFAIFFLKKKQQTLSFDVSFNDSLERIDSHPKQMEDNYKNLKNFNLSRKNKHHKSKIYKKKRKREKRKKCVL